MSRQGAVWIAGVLAMGMIAVTPVNASDLLDPPWDTTDDRATTQLWEFFTNSTTPAPDVLHNIYGTPTMTISPSHEWIADLNGALGVWPLSGLAVTDIPNRPEFVDSKLLMLQVVWVPETSDPYGFIEPVVNIEATDQSGNPYDPEDIVLLSKTDVLLSDPPTPTGPWHHTVWMFEIIPNPQTEIVGVSGSIMVDRLCVDTMCPEPTSMAILAAGAVGVLLRRRR